MFLSLLLKNTFISFGFSIKLLSKLIVIDKRLLFSRINSPLKAKNRVGPLVVIITHLLYGFLPFLFIAKIYLRVGSLINVLFYVNRAFVFILVVSSELFIGNISHQNSNFIIKVGLKYEQVKYLFCNSIGFLLSWIFF